MHNFCYQRLRGLIYSHLKMNGMFAVVDFVISNIVSNKSAFQRYLSDQVKVSPKTLLEQANKHYRNFTSHQVYCFFRSELNNSPGIFLGTWHYFEPEPFPFGTPCIDLKVAFACQIFYVGNIDFYLIFI